MAFKDLRDVVSRQFIDLPIGGKHYRVYSVDAETGLWVEQLTTIGIAASKGEEVEGGELDDVQELDLVQRCLGKTYGEMVADGVDWMDIRHAGMTAFMWTGMGEDAAQEYWEKSPSGELKPQTPETPTPGNRASRRASAAAVTTTRKRTAGSGTRASKTAAARRSTTS